MSQFVALIVFLIGLVPTCSMSAEFTAAPNSLRYSIGIAVSYFMALICRALIDLLVAALDSILNRPMLINTRLDASEAYSRCFHALQDFYDGRNLSLSCAPKERSLGATWRHYHDKLCWLMFLTPWQVPSILERVGSCYEELQMRLSFEEAAGTKVTVQFSTRYEPRSLYSMTPIARNKLKQLLQQELRS